MATDRQNPFSRIVDRHGRGLQSDVAMVQALQGIENQLKRLADVEEEKLKNERIAMASVREGSRWDAGGNLKDEYAFQPKPGQEHHIYTDAGGSAHPCVCSIDRNHGRRPIA